MLVAMANEGLQARLPFFPFQNVVVYTVELAVFKIFLCVNAVNCTFWVVDLGHVLSLVLDM